VTIPNPRVEIGFDLTSTIGPFFALDDATRGVLDNPDWTLGGTIFFDVTDRVRNIQIARGKPSDFANFTSGQASVEFNNHDRAFDPLYVDSPFAGNILPQRELRIFSNDILQFTGWVIDWDLTYQPNGDSIALAIANDALGILAGQVLPDTVPPEEKTGARIARVLSLPSVNWAPDLRDLDEGGATLGDQPITSDTNALTYLQQVAQAEPGDLFIDTDGRVAFRDRSQGPTSIDLVTFGGTAIPIANIEVIFGSEQLFNEVILTREGGGTAIAENTTSQGAYGIRTLSQSDLLLSDDEQLATLATVYAERFSEPEYRFDSFEVKLERVTPEQQTQVLNLELGDVIEISFTPNGIGAPIERYLRVVRKQQTIIPTSYIVEIGTQAIDYASLVLDDPEFGKLNSYSLSW
jgi:hypothetical protein